MVSDVLKTFTRNLDFEVNLDLSPKAVEIVDHTKVLLEAGGYRSFSFADISTRVNIRKASIYHHFRSKVELVRVVVGLYRQEAKQGMNFIDQQPINSLAKLQAYINYWSECIQNGKASFCICAMLAYEMPSLPDEVAKEVKMHFQDLTEWLTSLFKQCETQGVLHLKSSPKSEAKAFIANVYGAMLTTRVLGEPDVFQSVMKVTLDKLI